MNCSTKSIGFSLLVTMVATLSILTGCSGGETLGAGIPADQPMVALAEIVESPSKYHEKTIVVKGTVSSQCAALCDFSITDGKNTVSIFQQDFKFPKLSVGEPVTVYVQATSDERLILAALGMQHQ